MGLRSSRQSLGLADRFERLRQAETIGRPLGDEGFLARLEALTYRALTYRALKPAKRGRKPAGRGEDEVGGI